MFVHLICGPAQNLCKTTSYFSWRHWDPDMKQSAGGLTAPTTPDHVIGHG